jgi:hypothetical protein
MPFEYILPFRLGEFDPRRLRVKAIKLLSPLYRVERVERLELRSVVSGRVAEVRVIKEDED